MTTKQAGSNDTAQHADSSVLLQVQGKIMLQLCYLPFQSSGIYLPWYRHSWTLLAVGCSTMKGVGALCSLLKSQSQLTSIPKMTQYLVMPCSISVGSALLKYLSTLSPAYLSLYGPTCNIVTHTKCCSGGNKPLYMSWLSWSQLRNIWANKLVNPSNGSREHIAVTKTSRYC